MKRILLGFIFLFLFLENHSQTIISGMVTQEKAEALPGANVYLLGTYDGVTTNEKGEFILKTSKTGQYVLVVEFLGYAKYNENLNLIGNPINLNIKLKEEFNQLNAVTITAGTFEASDKKQAVTITPIDMVTTAGAAGDVYGALQSLPGTTTNGESGRLFVKGGDSEESQTYIDGALVYTPYISTAPNLATRGRFSPFMFKGTIFSTGGYSAEYGQALSSVLLLSTNDLDEEDQLDLSFLMVGVEMAGTKAWNSGAITGTITYNNLSPYMSVVPQNYNWVKAPESLTGAISLRQKTSKTGMLKIYSSFDNGNFNVKQNNPDNNGLLTDFNLENGNSFINASLHDKLGKKWSFNSAISFTNNIDEIRFENTTISKYITGSHLKTVFSFPFSEQFILKTGGELFTKSYSQEVILPNEKHENSFSNNTLSGFSEAQIYASSKFVARVGTRLEYSDYLERFNFAPRISSAYKITKNSQFSAAYGWFFQNPVDDYLLYTNLIKPERADHYTFSFQSAANSRTIRIELYYKDYKNLVKTTGNEFYLPGSYNNSGSGYAQGLDLFLRDKKSIKNGDYWISYSFIDTKRNYRNFTEMAIPRFVSKQNISVVYKHWFGSLRSLAGVNFKYSSPRVYNNPNSTIFNGEKMLPYRSLDASWSFLYRQNIIFYGAVTNIAGFKNEFGRNYSSKPDNMGIYPSYTVKPESNQFYVVGCFITLTRKNNTNQLEKIDF